MTCACDQKVNRASLRTEKFHFRAVPLQLVIGATRADAARPEFRRFAGVGPA
jgi:hypothetical protein